MSGASLGQMSLVGGLLAIAFAFLGVFMASSTEDPNVMRRVDSFGAALCAAVTTPEPEWWGTEAGTTKDAKALLMRYFSGDLTLRAERRKARSADDHKQTERNKQRLGKAELAAGGFIGAVRGIQLKFTQKGIRNHTVGAGVGGLPSIQMLKQVGDIKVGRATATKTDGTTTFAARIYQRDYKDRRGVKVGNAFVILSEQAITAKQGAGMWLFLAPLLVAVGVGLVIFTANNASSGMQSLARELDTIGRGRLDTRIRVTGSGEVGYLQRMADRMAKNLQMIQNTGSTDLGEAVEKEVSLAAEIHQSLRPSDPPRVPGYEVETLFKAGSDIGGDYFDYVELDEHRIALVIADCSESLRGVPAAMVMAMTRAYLKAAIHADGTPADWLISVNRQLSRDLKSGMAVTALIVVLDTSKGEVIAASAGHRPIVLWRKGKTAQINPNGIALGLDVGPVFNKTIEDKRFALAKNDRLVLYTDGLITAENGAGDRYGEERFLESVRKQGAMNSAAFVNFVAGGMDKFLEGGEQQDDITISTLKKMK
jgi:hypothetical protein